MSLEPAYARLGGEPPHPGGQGLLIGCSSSVGGMYVAALLGGAILADLEFAFDSRNRDAEADNAGQHGAAEVVWHGVPFFGKGRLVGLDEAGEQRIFAGIVFHQFKGAVGVDGDVIPRGDGERIAVIGGRDVAVRAGKDDHGFAFGEGLPVAIGDGEVAFYETVRALVFHDQRKVGGDERGLRVRGGSRAEEDGERVGLHRFNEDGTVRYLVEFG